MITNYIKSFDHERGCWAKKKEAADFAAFLAAELKLNPKAMVLEPDGRSYRIRIPLVSRYWHPIDAGTWEADFLALNAEINPCRSV